MPEYIDHTWTASPAVMAEALTALGWAPNGAEPTQPRHPAIAGFVVGAATDVGGAPAWTVLIRTTETLSLPAGVQLAPQWVSDALVGRIAASSPRTISAFAFYSRFTQAERIAMRRVPEFNDAEIFALAQGKVNLDSEEARRLLQAAVSFGVLTTERFSQILE